MEVIRDRHEVETVLLGQAGQLDQSFGPMLLTGQCHPELHHLYHLLIDEPAMNQPYPPRSVSTPHVAHPRRGNVDRPRTGLKTSEFDKERGNAIVPWRYLDDDRAASGSGADVQLELLRLFGCCLAAAFASGDSIGSLTVVR